SYYISPAGDNNWSGTSISRPWRSLAPVNSRTFSAGDQILLQAGKTFSGSIYLNSADQGTASAPIRISSYGSGRAAISASKRTAIYCYNDAGISVSNLKLFGHGA